MNNHLSIVIIINNCDFPIVSPIFFTSLLPQSSIPATGIFGQGQLVTSGTFDEDVPLEELCSFPTEHRRVSEGSTTKPMGMSSWQDNGITNYMMVKEKLIPSGYD